MFTHRTTSPFISKALGLGALFAALSTAAMAQVAITGLSYDLTATGTAAATSKINYTGDVATVSTVTTATGGYTMSAISPSTQVILRRPSSPGNFATTGLFQTNALNSTYSSQYSTTNSLMASGNAYAGLSNLFANGSGSNVERVDVYFGGSTSVQVDQGLVFFDLKLELGDSFRVALITGWDAGTGKPTSYLETTVLVTSDKFGSALITPDGTTNAQYQSAMYNAATDVLTGNPTATSLATVRDMTGVLVRFSDFGLSSSTNILGFSVMAGDVSSSSGSALVDYTNTSVYLNNTTGGVDFAGFNTAIASPVPEPSTYGMLLTAGSLGFFAWRRRRQSSVKAKV